MNDEIFDPIDEIVIDQEEVQLEQKRQLVDMLRERARIDVENEKIYLLRPSQLENEEHILVYLLAKLALELKNPTYSRSASPKEITSATKLPGGTVRPKLRKLFEAGIIRQGDNGYFVEPSTFSPIREILEGASED